MIGNKANDQTVRRTPALPILCLLLAPVRIKPRFPYSLLP